MSPAERLANALDTIGVQVILDREAKQAWAWLVEHVVSTYWVPPRTDEWGGPHASNPQGYWKVWRSLEWTYRGEQGETDLNAIVWRLWRERSHEGLAAEFHEAEAKKHG